MISRNAPRPFRLRNRRSLIGATVLLQALVIGLGWMATVQFASRGLGTRSHERVLDENARAAEHFSAALDVEVNGPTTPGSDAWEAAQALVEGYALPGGAFLMLLDEDGRVLCHPALRHNPNLRRLDYSEQLVTLSGDAGEVALRDLCPGVPVTGKADFLSGPVALAVLHNEAARVKIVVHQPEAGLVAAERRLTQGLQLWCGLAGLLVLGVTVAGSVVLVRRYDTFLIRANRALEREVARRTRQGLEIRNALIFGLAKLADYRDTDTGKHLERICRYCELLSLELMSVFPEIDRAWVERLKLASSMHDIGKVGIPDAVLLKPAAFTPGERRLMELHPLIGADTLIAIRRRVGDDDLLNMGVQVTLSHHERYDGRGYPYGLEGDQIPLSARIVALADMYDAMTSRRVYKEAMPHGTARDIILSNRGTHLDPRVVDAFARIEGAFDAARAAHTADPGDLRPPLQIAADRAQALRIEAAETRRAA